MSKKKMQEINEKELENVNAGRGVPMPIITCPYCGELLNSLVLETRDVKDGCSTKTEYKCLSCEKWF